MKVNAEKKCFQWIYGPCVTPIWNKAIARVRGRDSSTSLRLWEGYLLSLCASCTQKKKKNFSPKYVHNISQKIAKICLTFKRDNNKFSNGRN